MTLLALGHRACHIIRRETVRVVLTGFWKSLRQVQVGKRVDQSNEANAEQQLKPNTMDPPVEARLRFIFS
jgi:hypothetical protein